MIFTQHARRALAFLALTASYSANAQQAPAPADDKEALETLVTFTDGTVQRVTYDARGQAHLPEPAAPTKATPVSVRRVAVAKVDTTPAESPATMAPVSRAVVAAQPVAVSTAVLPSASPIAPVAAVPRTAVPVAGPALAPMVAVSQPGPVAATPVAASAPAPVAIVAAPSPVPAVAVAIPTPMPTLGQATSPSSAAIASGGEVKTFEPADDVRPRFLGAGTSVRSALSQWTSAPGFRWHLVWNSKEEFGPRLTHDLQLNGDFQSAVKALIAATTDAKSKKYPLHIHAWEQQNLLVVE